MVYDDGPIGGGLHAREIGPRVDSGLEVPMIDREFRDVGFACGGK